MYHDKRTNNISNQGQSFDIGEKQTSSTIVFHPDNPETHFLSAIYKDKNWDVINDQTVAPNIVRELIDTHDRIICLGCGSGNGFHGRYELMIDYSLVPILKNKQLIAIWTDADCFFKKHELKGFYLGDFLFKSEECPLVGNIFDDDLMFNYSNNLFAKVLGEHLDSDNILENVKRNYNDENDPLILSNRDFLFCNIGEI